MLTSRQTSSRAAVPVSTARRRRSHRGAVVLELIIALPILVIALLAIVEFGFLFHNYQQLALACRVGAIEASETSSPGMGGTFPMDVEDAILHQMQTAGIAPCRIILEENTGGSEVTVSKDYPPDDCTDCNEPTSTLPDNSVRVTICVHLTELMPNCLKSFGFDISGHRAQCSSTFGHEE